MNQTTSFTLEDSFNVKQKRNQVTILPKISVNTQRQGTVKTTKDEDQKNVDIEHAQSYQSTEPKPKKVGSPNRVTLQKINVEEMAGSNENLENQQNAEQVVGNKDAADSPYRDDRVAEGTQATHRHSVGPSKSARRANSLLEESPSQNRLQTELNTSLNDEGDASQKIEKTFSVNQTQKTQSTPKVRYSFGTKKSIHNPKISKKGKSSLDVEKDKKVTVKTTFGL